MRIKSRVGDELVQASQAVSVDHALAPEQLRRITAAGLLHNRNDHLAGDITAHHDGVDAVELAGVQELAQATVRPVNVGGEEDLRVLQWRAPAPAIVTCSAHA